MEDKNKSQLQEQTAPLKNDDNAYVRVGKNGEPVFPDREEESDSKEKNEGETTLDKR